MLSGGAGHCSFHSTKIYSTTPKEGKTLPYVQILFGLRIECCRAVLGVDLSIQHTYHPRFILHHLIVADHTDLQLLFEFWILNIFERCRAVLIIAGRCSYQSGLFYTTSGRQDLSCDNVVRVLRIECCRAVLGVVGADNSWAFLKEDRNNPQIFFEFCILNIVGRCWSTNMNRIECCRALLGVVGADICWRLFFSIPHMKNDPRNTVRVLPIKWWCWAVLIIAELFSFQPRLFYTT